MGRIKRALGKFGKKLQFLCCFSCFLPKTQRHAEVKQTNANRTTQQPDNSTKVSPVQSPTRERKARLPVSISQQEQQEQDELKIKAKLYIVSLLSKSFPLMSVVTATDIVGDERRNVVSSENETLAYGELPNNFVINCNSEEEIVKIFRELPYDLAINCNSEEEVVAGFHDLPYVLSIGCDNESIRINESKENTINPTAVSITDEFPVFHESVSCEADQINHVIDLQEKPLNTKYSAENAILMTDFKLLDNIRLGKNYFITSKKIIHSKPSPVQCIPKTQLYNSCCHSFVIPKDIVPAVNSLEQYESLFPSLDEAYTAIEAILLEEKQKDQNWKY